MKKREDTAEVATDMGLATHRATQHNHSMEVGKGSDDDASAGTLQTRGDSDYEEAAEKRKPVVGARSSILF